MDGDGTCAIVAPVGTDDPLRLRSLTTADAAALHRIYGHDETARFLSFVAKSRSEVEDVLRVVETDHATRPRTVHHYAAELDGDVVGVGRLGQGKDWIGHPAPDHVTLGFALRHDRTGRGLGRLLVAALEERAWAIEDADVLWGAVDPDNHASARVLLARGFEHVATTDHQVRHGVRRPSDVYVTRRPSS